MSKKKKMSELLEVYVKKNIFYNNDSLEVNKYYDIVIV